MDSPNLNLVPVSMKAKSPKELSVLCLMNNKLNGAKFNYMNPYIDGDGSIIIWFYADITTWEDPQKLSKKELDIMKGIAK